MRCVDVVHLPLPPPPTINPVSSRSYRNLYYPISSRNGMTMDTRQFRKNLDLLMRTSSRNEKKAYIDKMRHETAAISFLSGKEF